MFAPAAIDHSSALGAPVWPQSKNLRPVLPQKSAVVADERQSNELYVGGFLTKPFAPKFRGCF
jgi:hypothetical protein